jgi:hypothetical protein
MIAILDPALLLTDAAEGPLPQQEEQALSALVDDVARICRDYRARIPNVDEYWLKLQTELVRPLLKRTTRGPHLGEELKKWQQYASRLTLPGTPAAGKTKMWGVTPLFAWNRLPADWLGIMERLLIGCAQLDEQTVLVTRLFPGRNMQQHSVQRSTLTEKTRWRLYLHVPGKAPKHVPCVRNPRNLAVRWTTRFDEKLPDGGTYPFCPLPRWWRRDVTAHGTVESKPAWVDRNATGWAQPTTGGNHHWDVFIRDPNLQQAVGISPINVVAWGSTEPGKDQGEIHHVPKDKQGRFRGGGWTCPEDV